MVQDGRYLASIPGELVVRAQQDSGFAIRLLQQEERRRAITELGLEWTEELDARLEEIAQLSFEDAIQHLRNEGVARFA
jgi:hypothetical protein